MSGKPPLAIAAIFAAALLATPALADERDYDEGFDRRDYVDGAPRPGGRGERYDDDRHDDRDGWRPARADRYRGSWEDYADAYYGYGGCRVVERPIFDQWGEIIDYRRFRICN